MSEEEARKFIEEYALKTFAKDAGAHRLHLEQQFSHLKWGAGILFGLFSFLFVFYIGKSMIDFEKIVGQQVNQYVLTVDVQRKLKKEALGYIKSTELTTEIQNKASIEVRKAFERNVSNLISTQYTDIIKKNAQKIAKNPDSFTIPIGSIIAFGGPVEKCPVGWLPCDGRTLDISEYNELYNVISSFYGASNDVSFRIPSIMGKTIVGAGKGSIQNFGDKARELTDRVLGKEFGYENHILTIEEIPKHNHQYNQSAGKGKEGPRVDGFAEGASEGLHAAAMLTSETGSNKAHNNMQPSLVVNFIIKAK